MKINIIQVKDCKIVQIYKYSVSFVCLNFRLHQIIYEQKWGKRHSCKIQLSILSVREVMNYMLKFPARVNIQHFRNISRDVKHTHSETNYDHLIKIITPGKEGEKRHVRKYRPCLQPCIRAEHTACKIAKLFIPITSNTLHKCFLTLKWESLGFMIPT